MSEEYVILWKSTASGRTGKGTKHFSREEAVRLAEELNLDYPDILHEPVPVTPASPETLTDHPTVAPGEPVATEQSPAPLEAVLVS